MRAIRGAVQLDVDDRDHLLAAVDELIREILAQNALTTDDLISMLFNATADVHSTFPATAARARIPELADVPLMNTTELDVTGALQRCIRVLAHANTDVPRADVQHVFLEGAVVLRPDLAGTGS
jgi:chorismate mutase